MNAKESMDLLLSVLIKLIVIGLLFDYGIFLAFNNISNLNPIGGFLIFLSAIFIYVFICNTVDSTLVIAEDTGIGQLVTNKPSIENLTKTSLSEIDIKRIIEDLRKNSQYLVTSSVVHIHKSHFITNNPSKKDVGILKLENGKFVRTNEKLYFQK